MTIAAALLSVCVLAAAPAEPDVVRGKQLRGNRVAPFVDRTLRIVDVYGGVSDYFSSSETKVGLTADSHIKFRLWRAGLYAYLPKTEAHKAALKKLKEGDPVTVLGVVEARRIDGRRFTEIPVAIPDRDLVYITAKGITAGGVASGPLFPDPAKVNPDDYVVVDLEDVALQPSEYADNDIAITRWMGRSMSISRFYTRWEREQGLTKKNSIKLSVGAGFPVFIERSKENMETIKLWRKGQWVRMYGNLRVEETNSGDHPVLIVVRFERTKGKEPPPDTQEL